MVGRLAGCLWLRGLSPQSSMATRGSNDIVEGEETAGVPGRSRRRWGGGVGRGGGLAASPDPCWSFSGSGNQFESHQDFCQAQRCAAVCCRDIGYFMQNTQNSFFFF